MWEILAPFGLIALCGIVYRNIPGLVDPNQLRSSIGSIVLTVFVPLLTFGVLSKAPIGPDLIMVPLVSITTVVVGFVLSWIVHARLLRRYLKPPAIGALIIASTWCNAMYLGLPISIALVGDHVARIPILFDYLGMTPLLFTIGTMIGVEYGTRGTRHTIAEGIKQTLRMPPLIAAVAALCVNVSGFTLPEWLLHTCEIAGKVVAPLMIFSIGLALRMPRLQNIPLILPSVVLRICIVPLIILPLAQFLLSDPDILKSTMLEAGMPTMMLTLVFADRYGLDAELLAQAILVSTLAATLSIPVIIQMTS